MYMYMYIRVFDKLIWRTTGPKSLALHSSLFEPYGTVNVMCIITNSINSLLFGLRCTCIPNGAHTNHC